MVKIIEKSNIKILRDIQKNWEEIFRREGKDPVSITNTQSSICFGKFSVKNLEERGKGKTFPNL